MHISRAHGWLLFAAVALGAGCGEEFTAGNGGSGGSGVGGGQGAAPASGGGGGVVGGEGGEGGEGGAGGGAVVSDCQVPEDCLDEPGTSCVEGKCTCPSSAPAYCVPEGCIDPDASLFHCGGCDHPCEDGPNGAVACNAGECGYDCELGFADCDAGLGCETTTVDNPSSCGGCGISCLTECTGEICNDPVALAGGDNHTCVLRGGGAVWCWGANNWGQIGAPTGTNLNAFPVPVVLPPGKKVLRLAAGGRSTCAELDDASVFCWGGTANNLQQGGIVPGLSQVDELAAGGQRGCMVKGGLVQCWGVAQSPGNPLTAASSSKRVGAGDAHTCAVKLDGSAICWGENGHGQLGNGSTTDDVNPVVVSGLANADALALGYEHSCALAAGQVRCWGRGSSGQLGLGNTSDQLQAMLVTLPANVEAVYPSHTHSGARIGDKLYLWGKNDFRQTADSAVNPILTPGEYPLDQIEGASLGDLHTCVLRAGGEVLCWGSYGFGVLGNGQTSGSTATPTPVDWDGP
ncbi:MAG: hypothetical protein WKG00_18805 [Polyangiaceae bacterium]